MPNINGPLYYERMGRTGPVMAFVHPNPMDQSCWIYQMARFSTWFRCVAIDIPGYGRSPAGTAEMSRFDMAQALWETLDEICSGRACGACRLLRRLFPRAAHVQAQARADQGDDRLRNRLSRAR